MLDSNIHIAISKPYQFLLRALIVILLLNTANTSLFTPSNGFLFVEVEEEIKEGRLLGFGVFEVEKLNDTFRPRPADIKFLTIESQFLSIISSKLNPFLEIHSPPPEC